MIALLRVKNEARWIEQALYSALQVCARALVLDDHSQDRTVECCAAFPDVTVIASPFNDLNEVRDKNYLLELVERSAELTALADWVLMIDGDEVLSPRSAPALWKAMVGDVQSLSLRIVYLWDREDQVRVDGGYGRFWRPSAFRFRPGLRFVPLGAAAGGFHCSNAPAATWPGIRRPDGVELLHYGYLHQEDRLRKYEWYNRVDPGNRAEDGYRHMVIGDVFPADSKFLHGGPLELRPLEGAIG
jgi:glycosyltransferase involved in cell wall biosynthesis